MRKSVIIAVLGLAAATTYAAGYGTAFTLGGFYALSLPMGDVADAYGMSVAGFGAKANIGITPALSADVGFAYNLKYKGKWKTVWGAEPTDLADYSLTTIPIFYGVSYKFDVGAVKPYAAGGAAYVMEKPKVGASWTDPAPDGLGRPAPENVSKFAVYAGGGVVYRLAEKVGLDVNPRWLMVFDAVSDDPNTPTIDEATTNSTFVDVLVGVDYMFM